MRSLAANYLEALGVNTSKPFAVVETGEQLARNDEPSPTRSAVLTRLSHSHIRFGSFQRLAYLEQDKELARLVDYVVANFHPDADDDDVARKAVNMLSAISSATGHMIGQWMAAGFVHGVMNTDNFNITGETFDFGPWRFLPVSDPNFTAAYFDQQGLYRFGRQPLQGGWALQQLASALLPLATAEALATGLKPYERAYQESFVAHTHALLGLEPLKDMQADTEFLQAFYRLDDKLRRQLDAHILRLVRRTRQRNAGSSVPTSTALFRGNFRACSRKPVPTEPRLPGTAQSCLFQRPCSSQPTD